MTGYIGIFDHGSIFEESLWRTACLILLELLLKVVLFARVIVYPDRRIVKVPKLIAPARSVDFDDILGIGFKTSVVIPANPWSDTGVCLCLSMKSQNNNRTKGIPCYSVSGYVQGDGMQRRFDALGVAIWGQPQLLEMDR